MKVYLTFDMEGCTGTAIWGQMRPEAPLPPEVFSRAKRLATNDVLAAIEGILEVDPKAEILFNDGHATNMNVYFEEFPENVSAVINSREVFDEVFGLDASFDALIGVGIHGSPLIPDAVLCHNWNVREVKFNGKSLTEICLNASLAGYYGVPLVAMSGDEATVNYVKANISQKIAGAVVKKGFGRYIAISSTPSRTKGLIREAVKEGLKRRKEIPALTYKNPVTVEIEYPDQSNAQAVHHFLGDEMVTSTKIRFVADNAKDAYLGFLIRIKLSMPRTY
mgnify:CR=1 FL=1